MLLRAATTFLKKWFQDTRPDWVDRLWQYDVGGSTIAVGATAMCFGI